MSGGRETQNAIEIGRVRRDLEAALARIELLEGPKGDTGDPGPQGIQGAQGAQGIQGDKGDPGDAADAPVQSVNGKIGHVSLNQDDIAEGLTRISGAWANITIDPDEVVQILAFDQNYICDHVTANDQLTFNLLGGIGFTGPTENSPVNGARVILPVTPHANGIAFSLDFEYYDAPNETQTAIPLWKETETIILDMQYHAGDGKVYVKIRHPQWLKRSSADPSNLTFEWDSIFPEEAQSGAESFGLMAGLPHRRHGKSLVLPFEADGAGVTWGSPFVDVRDRLNGTLPDMTDSEEYLVEMQYDENGDQVLTKCWPMEPLVMVVTDADETQDANTASFISLNWDTNVRVKGTVFSHSTVSQMAKLNALQKGYYRIRVYIELQTGTNGLGMIEGQLEKNSTTFVGPKFYSTHLDRANGYREASIVLYHELQLAANDWIRVRLKAGNAVFTVNPVAANSFAYMEKIG